MKTNNNNPYDELGQQFLESFLLVQKDYEEGKVKEINEETIAYYSNKVPVENTANMEIANAVTDAINNSTYTEVINNSENFGDFSKDILIRSLEEGANLDQLVEEVNNHDLPPQEKEFVLKSMAITYYMRDVDGGGQNQARGRATGAEIGAAIGFIIGAAFCVLCALGGALLGGLIGSES